MIKIMFVCHGNICRSPMAEFASNCELDNHNSYEFHMATGFTETNRIICFKKEL